MNIQLEKVSEEIKDFIENLTIKYFFNEIKFNSLKY